MTEPGTDLDRQDPAKPLPVLAGKELEETYRIADALYKSGIFDDIKKAEEAFARILFGRDLGLSPTEAMEQINVIDGKPSVSANLQASRVKASGKYDYTVADLTDERCEITFWQDGDEIGTSTFTMEDAERAGLTKPTRSGKPSNYTKYPRNMLFARAISNGVAWYCPDVMGGLRVYHEGEIEVRDVSAGSGDYTEPEDLRAAIEEWAPSQHWASVIATTVEHARKLGHAGYSDYGSVELALKGQPPDFLMRWVSTAEEALSQFVAARPSDATWESPKDVGEVVGAYDADQTPESRPSEDESLTAEILEARALKAADEADDLDAKREKLDDELGEALVDAKVEELRAEAASLHDQAEAMKQQEMKL